MKREVKGRMSQLTCTVGAILLVGSVVVYIGCQRGTAGPGLNGTGGGTVTAQLAPPLFTEVTEETGVDFTFRNGQEDKQYSIVESLGGGVAIFDYDLDGLLDLFFTGGGGFEGETLPGLPAGLRRNLGDLRFDDVTAAAGDGFPAYNYTHGPFAADYDNDGFSDVLITGYGGVQLWHNEGDGTFTEVKEAAGLHDDTWSSAAAWGDVNGDGYLDLYLGHYGNWSFENHPYCMNPDSTARDICPPREFDGLPDLLYMNNGDGTFREASVEAGLRTDGKCLGVLIVDFDGDEDLDIYVANDEVDNFLYLNDGDGQFEELGMMRGVAVDDSGTANGSMGMDICDYNQDGRPDIWITHFEREDFALYRNEGDGRFLHVSQMTGISVLGGLYVGFGTVCADFDHDGDEDIAVANGHVVLFPTASPRKQEPLFLEADNHRFKRVKFSGEGYFSTVHEGRGLASGDLDEDGDLDLVFSHMNAPASIVRNDVATGDWLAVRLIGRESNRGAVGARLSLKTSIGELVRHIKAGTSYMATSDPRAFWGLPAGCKIEQLTVRWPSGRISTVSAPEVNQTLMLLEPTAE